MRLLLAVMATFVLASCGDDASPTTTSDFDAIARTVVPTVPLTAADLPAGWQATDEPQALIDELRLPASCDIFDLDVTFPGAAATASGGGYESPSGEQILSFAAAFPTAATAQSAVEGTRELLDRCGGEFKNQIKAISQQQLDRLGVDLGIFADIDVSLEERGDEQTIGDSSVAYRSQVRVNVIGNTFRFTLDVRVLQVGQVAAAITYAVFGDPDENEERAIAETLRSKAAAAGAQLP